MNELIIRGEYASAKVFTNVIEDEAKEQIKRMLDTNLCANSTVRIMPDVHARKGCTIGTTMTKDELLLIPLNMRDGSILGKGKGNSDWNYSAPHGAGRLMSRAKAKETLTLENFEKSMEGIYSTTVDITTIDEAPMAYKSIEDILEPVKETVEVLEILKPIYNFKASEQEKPW